MTDDRALFARHDGARSVAGGVLFVGVRRGLNLCFHGIGEPQRELEEGERDYWISPDLFTTVLDLVQPRPDVWLSFDDGNRSDVEIALPALRARGLRAAFFPIAGRLGQPGSLATEDVRELVDAGMTVGSHGMRHRRWQAMSPTELDDELVEARKVLAAAARAPIVAAACPLGAYDRRVLGRLRELDYGRIYTSDRVRAASAAWVQPRFSVRDVDTVATVRELFDRPRTPSGVARDRLRLTVKRWR